MKKNILVTGGAGYIGSTLVTLLLSKGYDVTVYDNLSFGGESLFGAWMYPHFTLIKGDISDDALIDSVLAVNHFDTIVHLAAMVGDPACAKQPERARKVNYDSSLGLLQCALKHKVRQFIFASTCSNYGRMLDPSGYVDELSPLAPISLYAELKVKMEEAILESAHARDWFYPVILRFATVFGVSPRMRLDLTVNEFTKELALGRELVVFGEQFCRPYCHVQDIARAVMLAIENNLGRSGGFVYNVGDSEQNYPKQEIVDEIRKVIPEARVKYVKKLEDPRDYRVSFEKIKKELGFKSSKTLLDGIKEVKFIIDNNCLLDPDDKKYKNS